MAAPDAAIHQNACEGFHFVVVSTAGFVLAGSRRNKTAGISSTAGAAASAIAILQPNACATGPPTAKLSSPPTGTAIMNQDMARERRLGGVTSPIQLAATGVHTASPMPTPRRVKSSMP